MKKALSALLSATILSGCATTSDNCDTYALAGAGYKFAEQELYGNNVSDSKISARLEFGRDCGKIRYGLSHHSQYLDGIPFNNKKEYHKSELFVDFVHKF